VSLIEHIKLLRNVGKFESVNGQQLPLAKLALVYAENGRGKTTLAAIFRSLSTGASHLILERRRLTASHPPHIVIKTNAAAPIQFKDGAWSSTISNLAIFDDTFVAKNICSGIEIQTEHRQNLHELIVGAQGVTLTATLQSNIEKIEEHNRNLRSLGDAIPASDRGGLTIDAFCALKPNAKIADEIKAAEQALAAAKSSDAVKNEKLFQPIALPSFDTKAIDTLLGCDLSDLDAKAAAGVQSHFAAIGDGGEEWVGDGMQRIARVKSGAESCPFCAQELKGSALIEHYRAYFSKSYAGLKQDIANALNAIDRAHGGDVVAAFERSVRVAEQSRTFWKDFASVPEVAIDTAEIVRAWKVARDQVAQAMRKKQAAPLEPHKLDATAAKAIESYEAARKAVEAKSSTLGATNASIELVKERAAAANVAALTADLAKLKAVKARYSTEIALRCEAYLDEKEAKANTEKQRDATRAALDNYRQQVFPAYETAINAYLGKFNAGFRLGSVTSVNTRAGSSCNYSVVINNIPIPVTASGEAEPSFRTALSAGDRNTLALAFFFASIDQDPNIAQKVVVIDDPMTSLDEHRALTTRQEMRRLAYKVSQVIVLSHSKPFLFALWEDADKIARSALKITRDHDGSTLEAWNVDQDCITEHDRRHALVAEYVRTNNSVDEQAVAAALRPILEVFVRVGYPEEFPPGSLLGPFINLCVQRHGKPNQTLTLADTDELRDLLDYANKFHHDTNAAWETEIINDQELQQFCKRTLAFARR
jgi:wobble nucleotide-excising tRNase